MLSLGHLARIHQNLDRAKVEPVIRRGLQDSSDYVRGQAQAAADDIEHYLKWKIVK